MLNIMLLGVFIVFIAVLALLLPNKIIDTSSCKRNWILILTILIGATLIIGQFKLTQYLSCALSFGILINYAFPILLNAITVFNRKTDP